jgi:hypothetical protein
MRLMYLLPIRKFIVGTYSTGPANTPARISMALVRVCSSCAVSASMRLFIQARFFSEMVSRSRKVH